MERAKRPSQVIHDLRLGLHVTRPGFGLLVSCRRLTENVRRHPIVVSRQVFDLLTKGAHTRKFTIGRRKPELVGGHGIDR